MYQQLTQHTPTGSKRYNSITFCAQFGSVTGCTQHVLSVRFDTYLCSREPMTWSSLFDAAALTLWACSQFLQDWLSDTGATFSNTAQLPCSLEMFLFTTINTNSFLLQNTSLSHSKIMLVELTIFIFYHRDNENHCLII